MPVLYMHNSFNPHKNLMKWALLLSLNYRKLRHRGVKQLAQVTQQVSDRAMLDLSQSNSKPVIDISQAMC